jgi:hypothetical protein
MSGQLINVSFAERDQLAAVQQLLIRQHLAVFALSAVNSAKSPPF